MARILFGSEFGANLGHIYPMLRLADVFANRGHEVVFVARNVPKTHQILKSRGYRVIQAPYWVNPPFPNLRQITTPSYADVLVRQGFGQTETLNGMFAAWSNIIELLKPNLVIADHSPGMSLAARDLVPMINIGNGFTLPPSELKEYPAIIAEGKPLMAQTRLLGAFNEVLATHKRSLLEFLPQIFDTEGQYVCTVPQLDPYAKYRTRVSVGPLEKSMKFAALPRSPHIFLYMAHEAGPKNVALDALQKLGITATVFLRDAPQKTLKKYASDKINMLGRPADFSEIIPKSSLVIHSGGGGTSTSCLMTGRPQITFPTHSETMLNSKLMSGTGVATAVRPDISLEQFSETLKRVVDDQKMKDRAISIAEQLSSGDWRSALTKITNHAEVLMT